MIFDFHTHTRQQDGANSAREMVEAAIEKGLAILGISEHSPRLPEFRYVDDPPGAVRGAKNWAGFLAEIDSLKIEFADRIEILKGCEMDWLGEQNLDWARKFLADGDFDYSIGSVHFLEKWGFDYEKDWRNGFKNFADITEIYRAYFLEYSKMVRSGLFDIAGHFDLIKKFNDKFPLSAATDILELARPALDALANSKMVLEISSAGLTKPCAEWYPSLGLLRAAFEKNIPITINSDAHSTARIAENFSAVKDFARSAGYSTVTIFHEKGAREEIKI